MKKYTDFLRTVIVLVALMCITATAAAQSINAPTAISESEDGSVQMLKAGNIPMQKRLGDVNLDGMVSIADVTALIDMLLSGTPGSNADVNADDSVSIADVTALIDMLLSGSSNYVASLAQSALDDIYYSMRMAGWSTTGNTHQSFGISAYNLMAEVMGDDMIMGAQGSGWFWYDAGYNVKGRYTSNIWRSHDLWTAYYTWIANANYILAGTANMSGTSAEKNYIKGQAYAIRAYSYFMLAQSFARTYKGHESDPCVPIFDGMVFNGSTGKLRSTVAEVYAQIDSDINQAVSLLDGTTQQQPSHMGYAVALGLQSRIALVEENWSQALTSAVNAISASGKSIQDVADFKGLNDVSKGNVMWGYDIPADEAGMYASFWAHMSTNAAYGQRAPKEISKWLYNKISSTDARRAWWTTNNTGYGTDAMVQDKFNVIEGTEWEGDYIWMRVEEMYLTAAEAACRLGRTTPACGYLNQLMSHRDANYNCSKTGTELGALTTDETGSLLEEILIQRRIELWGEDGRIYTIRRLRQGFERTTENGWPTNLLLESRSLNDPESYPWVLTIPLSEYYNYYARMILDADQNPTGDNPSVDGLDLEREPQHISFTQDFYSKEIGVADSYSCVVTLTRPNTSTKPYYALLRLTEDGSQTSTWYYVTFNANQRTSSVSISFNGESLTLGRHNYTFTLTDLEMSVATSSQMTSTKIQIDCSNIGAEGQHISFATAEQKEVTYQSGYLQVPITLTRADATNSYRAELSISNQTDPDDIRLGNQYVVFQAGESTATAYVNFYEMEVGNIYSCVLSLSDADIATGNPSLGEQITSTTVMVEVKDENEGWESAGTCTFTDYTWNGATNPSTALNVPVQRFTGTNTYRLVSPVYSAYRGQEDEDPIETNWKFTLNDDGSITPPEGLWDLSYWGYLGEYIPSTYPTYCYVEQDGNTYDVYFILNNNGNRYSGGHFSFTWDR